MNLPAGDGRLGPLDHLWVSKCELRRFGIYSSKFQEITVRVFLQHHALHVVGDLFYVILRVHAAE